MQSLSTGQEHIMHARITGYCDPQLPKLPCKIALITNFEHIAHALSDEQITEIHIFNGKLY